MTERCFFLGGPWNDGAVTFMEYAETVDAPGGVYTLIYVATSAERYGSLNLVNADRVYGWNVPIFQRPEVWQVWWWPEGLELSDHEPPVPRVNRFPSLADAIEYAVTAKRSNRVSWVRVLGPRGEMEPDAARWSADRGWTISDSKFPQAGVELVKCGERLAPLPLDKS